MSLVLLAGGNRLPPSAAWLFTAGTAIFVVLKNVHWADVLAERVIKESGKEAVVASGITPSGPIHLGNLREVITADAIYRALQRQGATAKLLFIADTFDPLRRVYPFLPESYRKFIGRPLSDVPDPAGCCSDYAEHFLRPFLEVLTSLGIEPEVFRAHELYGDGVFQEAIAKALEQRDAIAETMRDVAGRELPADWWPLMVKCRECGRMSTTKILDHDRVAHTVGYECSCGHSGRADYGAAEAKLSWRVDWPARWRIFGVTIEPFGKDHAAPGGSYDTGRAIAAGVYGYQAPTPLVYEWIFLKGKGAMASSTGVAIPAEEMLRILAPEVLRFLMVRARPEKHLEFDPVMGLLQTAQDYQELEREYYAEQSDALARRIYELSQVGKVPGKMPIQLPFLHLATVFQTAHGDTAKALDILSRTGYPVPAHETVRVNQHLELAGAWLEKWAPKEFRFTLRETLPPEAGDLSSSQKQLLSRLAVDVQEGQHAEEIHQVIHQQGKDLGLSAKQSFSAVYIAFLGRPSGPRAGWFLASLPRDFMVRRLREASD